MKPQGPGDAHPGRMWMDQDYARAARQARARFSVSPRVELAVKCGVAAALAWFVVGQVIKVSGFTELESYTYYAPFGAVMATNPTVVESVRVAWKAALALAAGAAVGLAVSLLFDPSLLSLAFVVGLGVLLGPLPVLGDQRSWVPSIALFVVMIGGAHPTTYALAYVALAAFGALCGVAVNLAFPSLPSREQQWAVEELRGQLGDQLSALAGRLRGDPGPKEEGWREGSAETQVARQRARTTIEDLMLAQRANPRGHRHRTWVRRQAEVARALERAAAHVDDLAGML